MSDFAPFSHSDVKRIAKLVRKYNTSISRDVTVDEIERKIENVAYEYLHSTTGYVSTYGVVFSFFNGWDKNRYVKFSLDISLFSNMSDYE